MPSPSHPHPTENISRQVQDVLGTEASGRGAMDNVAVGEAEEEEEQQQDEDDDHNHDDNDYEDEEGERWSAFDLVQFRTLVESSPDKIKELDCEGDTILHQVVGRKDENVGELVALVTWLVDEKGADVNGGDCYGLAPLHLACMPELVSVLLERGGDPRCIDEDGWTPLAYQALEQR